MMDTIITTILLFGTYYWTPMYRGDQCNCCPNIQVISIDSEMVQVISIDTAYYTKKNFLKNHKLK